MGLITLVFSIIVFLYCLTIANGIKGPHLRSAFLHPFFFFGLFTLLIGLDFFVLESSLAPYERLYFSQYLLMGKQDYTYAALSFITITISAILGFTFGELCPIPTPVISRHFSKKSVNSIESRSVIFVFIGLFIVFLGPKLAIEFSRGGLLAIAGIRSVFLAQNSFFTLILSGIVPAYFLYAAGSEGKKKPFVSADNFGIHLHPLGESWINNYASIGVCGRIFS